MIGNMRFLIILNGHELLQPDRLGCIIDFDHERKLPVVEAFNTISLVEYLSLYPAVKFHDDRPAVIEVAHYDVTNNRYYFNPDIPDEVIHG